MVTKTSSRAIPPASSPACNTSPTSRSFRYRSAQSKCRNPASSASPVALIVAVTSGIRVPNPSTGMWPAPWLRGILLVRKSEHSIMIWLPVRILRIQQSAYQSGRYQDAPPPPHSTRKSLRRCSSWRVSCSSPRSPTPIAAPALACPGVQSAIGRIYRAMSRAQIRGTRWITAGARQASTLTITTTTSFSRRPTKTTSTGGSAAPTSPGDRR